MVRMTASTNVRLRNISLRNLNTSKKFTGSVIKTSTLRSVSISFARVSSRKSTIRKAVRPHSFYIMCSTNSETLKGLALAGLLRKCIKTAMPWTISHFV